MRVAIAGAGLGGLCLAQGLVRAGVDVHLYERDAALGARRQGYRLHVDARAALSLQKCLPPDLFRLFLDTTGQPSTKITVLDRRLRVLHERATGPQRDPDDPATLSTSVDRGILREILAAGLDDRIHFSHELTGFDQDADGATLRFATGDTARADFLVGADGIGSAVRRQLLPGAEVVDTGERIIYGKTPLNAAHAIPAAMREGFTAIVGGHIGVAAGLVKFRRRLDEVDDYAMWAVSAREKRFPDLTGLDAAGLHTVACEVIRSWHPDIRALLAAADVDETFLVRVRVSRRVAAWPSSRVTLLGDAIHAMSPARGSGANTALLDAAGLCAALTGKTTIDAYEESMRTYGFASVEASRPTPWGRLRLFRRG